MKQNRRRISSLLLLGVMTFFAFGSSDSSSTSSSSSSDSSPSSSSSSSSSTSSSTKDLGYEGKIDVGGGEVPVASSEEALGEMTNSAVAKDKEGLAKMMLNGQLFSVPNGTKARLIGRNWTGGIRVRILDGSHYGDDGWIPGEFLK
jgi:hypothetical protein